MSEQADALASNGPSDLASFLSDNPASGPEHEDDEAQNSEDAIVDDDNAESENDQQDDLDPSDKEDADAESEDDEDKPPTPDQKITIKVKGKDGEETLQLTHDEIASSYLRQGDYTKKMQGLAERENQAVQFLQTKHEEVRNQYLEQAAFARSAVEQMAGFRTESEMAQLAHSDPAAWVAENQRQGQIKAFLGTLDSNLKREREQASEQSKAQQQKQYQQTIEASWSELAKEKIDRPALVKIYESTAKHFGFKPEEMGNITDHRVVKMMRDAAAYRELKAKAPEVTRKAQDAPRMPAARQATPAQERQKQALAKPFQGGRAKLNDLAAYLR